MLRVGDLENVFSIDFCYNLALILREGNLTSLTGFSLQGGSTPMEGSILLLTPDYRWSARGHV